MNDDVTSFLNRVRETQLYCNVGMSITDPVSRVQSWSDALKCIGAIEWEDFVADRHNEMFHHDPNDSKFWKTFSEFNGLLRSSLDAILTSSTSKLDLSEKQHRCVFNETRSQFLRAGHEIEYRESLRVTSPWHLEVSEWYFRGHFPCGWQGDWPEDGNRSGRLIVF